MILVPALTARADSVISSDGALPERKFRPMQGILTEGIGSYD